MAEEKDVLYVNIKGGRIGIIGLKVLMEEAKAKAFSDEELLARFLLEGVKKRNYVPPSFYEEYSRKLLKEYKKFIGTLREEDREDGILEIKVLGPSCLSCDKLEQETMAALAEMNLPADLEHIREPGRIGGYGIMGTPGLIINGKVKSVGRTLNKEEIKKLIKEELNQKK